MKAYAVTDLNGKGFSFEGTIEDVTKFANEYQKRGISYKVTQDKKKWKIEVYYVQ